MILPRLAAGTAALLCALPAASAGLLGHLSHGAPIGLRKRLHVNPLITDPGTMDVEWGGAFSTGGSFSFPSTVRYTPEGPYIFWGRTEFSASFDSLSSAVQFDDRATQFSDRVTVAANCVVYDGKELDIAIAPQTSFFLRGDRGVRAGATAIARYDHGRNSAGMTVTWTAATAASATNPAGTLDIGLGYGRRLMASGPLSHLTPHVNWLWERSTGNGGAQISLFEGAEYQITDNVAVDFSAQHFSVWGGQVDHQIVVGLTVNAGHLRHKKQQ